MGRTRTGEEVTISVLQITRLWWYDLLDKCSIWMYENSHLSDIIQFALIAFLPCVDTARHNTLYCNILHSLKWNEALKWCPSWCCGCRCHCQLRQHTVSRFQCHIARSSSSFRWLLSIQLLSLGKSLCIDSTLLTRLRWSKVGLISPWDGMKVVYVAWHGASWGLISSHVT